MPDDDLADDAADEFRFALASPQAYVFQLVKAQLDGDTDTIETLFAQTTMSELLKVVTVIAVAELSQELIEHRGDRARD